MARLALVLVAALLGPACAEPASDSADPLAAERAFAAEHARAACALYERCGLLSYYGATLEGCLTDLETATFEHITEDGCSFDPDAGAACVTEFEAASCETSAGDAPTACSAVCGD